MKMRMNTVMTTCAGVVFAVAFLIAQENANASVIQTEIYNGHTYYLLDKGPWWDDFEAEAIALGGHLATINDQAENDFIFNTFGPTAAAGNPPSVSLFIGLNDVQEEGHFVWVSGEPVVFINWSLSQPQGVIEDEDYVGIGVNWGSVVENGKWHDIISNGRLSDITYGVVEVPEPPTLPVSIDIKPGSCPNPLNVKDKGVLSVAILGSEDFDVWTMDVASIRLKGVAPVRSSYEDVATPMPDGAEVCECTTAGPDGQLDLTLKFNVQDIVAALGPVNNGDELELTLTGALDEVFGGTLIEGTDCVVVQGAK